MKNKYVFSTHFLPLILSFLFVFNATTIKAQCGSLSFGTVTFNSSEGFFEVDVFYDRSAPGVILELIQTSIKFDDSTVEIDLTKTEATASSDFLVTVSTAKDLVSFNGFNPGTNGITLGGGSNNLIGTIHFTMLSGETTNITFNNKTIREKGSPSCQASATNGTYTAPLIEIKGQGINYASSNGLPNAVVFGDNLTRSNPTDDAEDTTPSNGQYALTAIGGNDYDVSFTVDGPSDGGSSGCVNSLDIDVINDHIFGIDSFTDPAEYLAGDMNNNQTVTTADRIKVQKVILGVDPDAFSDRNWLEIPKAEFNAYSNPTTSTPSINGIIDIDNISGTAILKDFFAIKGGDVNFSCTTVTTTARFLPNEDILPIKITPQSLIAGQSVMIAIYGPEFSDASVVSIGLAPIPGLDVIGIESGLLKVDKFNFNIKSDVIDFLWATDDAEGTKLVSDSPLFYIKANPTKDFEDISSLLKLKNNRPHTNIITHLKRKDFSNLEIEVSNVMEGKQLQLESRKIGRHLSSDVLVTPNPFNHEFMLSINSSKKEIGYIRLMNGQSGALISQIPFSFHEGLNNVDINELAKMPAGLYTYQVILDGKTLSGKLIKSE